MFEQNTFLILSQKIHQKKSIRTLSAKSIIIACLNRIHFVILFQEDSPEEKENQIICKKHNNHMFEQNTFCNSFPRRFIRRSVTFFRAFAHAD